MKTILIIIAIILFLNWLSLKSLANNSFGSSNAEELREIKNTLEKLIKKL